MLTEADNTLERLCLVMVMDWAESNLLYLIRNHTCDKENQIPAWLQTELDDTKCRYFFFNHNYSEGENSTVNYQSDSIFFSYGYSEKSNLIIVTENMLT